MEHYSGFFFFVMCYISRYMDILVFWLSLVIKHSHPGEDELYTQYSQTYLSGKIVVYMKIDIMHMMSIGQKNCSNEYYHIL